MPNATTRLRAINLSPLAQAGPAAHLLALAFLGAYFSPLIGMWTETAKVGSVLWRFGGYGLLLGGLFHLFTALAISSLAAAALGQRRLLLSYGAGAALLTLLLLVGLPLFVLDFLQLRQLMDPAAFAPFQTAGLKVFAMAAVGIPVLGFAARELRHAGKAIEPAGPSRGGRRAAGGQ